MESALNMEYFNDHQVVLVLVGLIGSGKVRRSLHWQLFLPLTAVVTLPVHPCVCLGVLTGEPCQV